MNHKDIRWVQRFSNFNKALQQLTEFINKGKLNKLEEQGLIQSFEYTHELAWNTLKDLLEYRGHKEIYGSKDATRKAFQLGLIENGEAWMKMIENRNESTHTYNEETASKICNAILHSYYNEFVILQKKLRLLAEKEQA